MRFDCVSNRMLTRGAVPTSLFKNKLITFRNEAYLTAEAQRTQRLRREKWRIEDSLLLFSSPRGLCVLCASAVSLDWIPELIAQSDQLIFEQCLKTSVPHTSTNARQSVPDSTPGRKSARRRSG